MKEVKKVADRLRPASSAIKKKRAAHRKRSPETPYNLSEEDMLALFEYDEVYQKLKEMKKIYEENYSTFINWIAVNNWMHLLTDKQCTIYYRRTTMLLETCIRHDSIAAYNNLASIRNRRNMPIINVTFEHAYLAMQKNSMSVFTQMLRTVNFTLDEYRYFFAEALCRNERFLLELVYPFVASDTEDDILSYKISNKIPHSDYLCSHYVAIDQVYSKRLSVSFQFIVEHYDCDVLLSDRSLCKAMCCMSLSIFDYVMQYTGREPSEAPVPTSGWKYNYHKHGFDSNMPSRAYMLNKLCILKSKANVISAVVWMIKYNYLSFDGFGLYHLTRSFSHRDYNRAWLINFFISNGLCMRHFQKKNNVVSTQALSYSYVNYNFLRLLCLIPGGNLEWYVTMYPPHNARETHDITEKLLSTMVKAIHNNNADVYRFILNQRFIVDDVFFRFVVCDPIIQVNYSSTLFNDNSLNMLEYVVRHNPELLCHVPEFRNIPESILREFEMSFANKGKRGIAMKFMDTIYEVNERLWFQFHNIIFPLYEI